MRPENRFKAVSHVVRTAVFAVLCTLSVSCSKDEVMPIPDSLSESVWTMWTEEGSKELAFYNGWECSLIERPLDGTPVEYRYIYKYTNPDLSLRPYDEGRGEELKGYIFRWDDLSICLTLYSVSDNTAVFIANKGDGEKVWADQ